MASHIYIGLDLGSTSLKIAAFEGSSGTALAQAGAAIPWQRAATGSCQVPGHVLRPLIIQLLSQVSQQLGARATDVAAMACVGHGGGLYVVDAEGALHDDFAVSSTDQRATPIANALAQTDARQLFNTVGTGPWSGQPSMIAADIARLNPDALQQAHTLFFAKDYVAMVLSGERATDYSDASTAGLLDCTSRRPAQRAFAVANAPTWHAGLLARLQDSGSPLGHLLPGVAAQTGLPASTPIAMGAIDLYGAMAGVGATQTGDVAAVLGTWCVNAAIGANDGSITSALHNAAAGISNVVLLDSGKAVMYMNNGASAMANTTWLAGTLQQTAAQLLDAAFSSEPGAHGLRYLPFINGGGNASAGFLGLRAFHTPADMARAAVEGVLALHAKNLNALAASGVPRQRLFALGGGAGDERLSALLATLMDSTVYTPGADESGARGAAMFAATSVGHASAPLQATLKTVQPITALRSFYAQHLASFEALVDEMGPIFARLNQPLP
jgi:L-xylulokinase